MMLTRMFLVLLACTLSMRLCAQATSSGIFKDLEIRQGFIETPRISAGNIPEDYTYQQRWFEIDVQYTTLEKKLKGFKDKFEWLDDFTIKYEVLMDTVYMGKKVPALLIGEVEYWSVELDGKKHYAQAFIPPRVLKRYASPDMKLKGKSTAKTIRTRVSFYSKDKRLIARVYNVPKNSTEAKVAKEFMVAEKALGVLKLENSVFPRNKTPWFVLNFDKYELIKDQNRR